MIGIPFATNGWDEILPGLFMGGHDRAGVREADFPLDVVVDREFDLVISLYHRRGFGPADDVEHRLLIIPDGTLLDDDAATAGQLADRAADTLATGKRVLIRCQAGYNRSGLVVALTLLRLGYSADEAIALIRERRSPHAVHNSHFVEHLRSIVVPPRRIQRRRKKGWVRPQTAVDVTRPGRWGNPFAVGKTTPAWGGRFDHTYVANAAQAVELYRQLLTESPHQVAEIREQLAGKHLMCWCKPNLPCHADVLLAVAAGENP